VSEFIPLGLLGMESPRKFLGNSDIPIKFRPEKGWSPIGKMTSDQPKWHELAGGQFL
jgi:hypothetical protein